MESIAQSAVAGLIAALVATTILGLAKYTRDWLLRRQDVRYIRDLVIEGRSRVMKAEETYHQGMGAKSPADNLRAAQYNNMIRQLSVALESGWMNLSHSQRKDIYDALDWYHTQSLYAINRDGLAVYQELPDGKWPTTEMTMEEASGRTLLK